MQAVLPPYISSICWPDGADKTLISLFTSLIHSFNTFLGDSLVFKLTCQHFALPMQEHWVEKEGKCWLHCNRRRKHSSSPAIFLLSMAFPGMPCSKKLGQPACRQKYVFVRCHCIGLYQSCPIPFRFFCSQ